MHDSLSKQKHYGQPTKMARCKLRAIPKRPITDKSQVDSILRRINTKVASQIDCTKCAKCCKDMGPRLSKRDVRAISQCLGIAQEMVVSKYLRKRKDKAGEYLTSKIPCPFLKKNRCSIYEVRPKGCKSYPHIKKNAESILRLVGIAGSSSICPIVADVLDQLKAEINLGV
jgi:hypothetical protein